MINQIGVMKSMLDSISFPLATIVVRTPLAFSNLAIGICQSFDSNILANSQRGENVLFFLYLRSEHICQTKSKHLYEETPNKSPMAESKSDPSNTIPGTPSYIPLVIRIYKSMYISTYIYSVCTHLTRFSFPEQITDFISSNCDFRG